MADTDDQNTPNDDFSQSIDAESGDDALGADLMAQQTDLNEESSSDDPLAALGSESGDAESSAEGPPSGPENPENDGSVPAWDESTLVGRLERKLFEVNDVLWEKEGLQMQYTFKDHIREEYYKRWKNESNAFLILAARLRRRLEKERAKAARSA